MSEFPMRDVNKVLTNAQSGGIIVQTKSRVEDDLDVEAWVQQMIAENGYAQISKHDPSLGLPGFAFTIGLEHSRQVPELMCLGVAPDIAAQLFAMCIEGHDASLCDLAIGNQSVLWLVEGYTLRFRCVSPAMVLKANEVRPHRREDISDMVQLLLPDNNGFSQMTLSVIPEVPPRKTQIGC
ncbi:DUF4262 domain-containing protein [uncultured Roseobacter sp.]|uniref:DUF4262 domain-containing protein n=1 Tax=uncultured Roseobacter sp. TaxID=114847 RepID=UPI002611E294|nr:DUF4262 domain-containing protein [uncultured Roseobacter sp.]